jgi:hypothetical protein
MGEEHFNYGENNPSFKGDEAGYGAIHAWVRRRKLKPALCEKCGLVPPRDLANKSGKYLRDLSDWDYLCRKCHMDSDNRNSQLRVSGKSRKLPNKVCKQCGSEFEILSSKREYCSRVCAGKAKIVMIVCKFCGVDFRPKIANKRSAKFCSRSCSANFQWSKA